MRKKSANQLEIQGAAVLHLRSQRANSRSNLAQLLEVSPSTVGLYVDHMISKGFMDESGLEKKGMGRPRRKLSLRPDAGWFAGVELNAERIQTVSVDFSGNAKESRTDYLPPDADASGVLRLISSALKKLGQKQSVPLLGIGVGAPGVVDPAAGVGIHYSFIRNWDNVRISERLGKRFQIPVTLENNLRVIAVAERWFGGGRGLDDFIILGPRSGFGIAMVQSGKLVHGTNHAAGEIGRWPWPLTSNGKNQQVQDALSAPAIYRRLAGLSNRGRLPNDLHWALTQMAGMRGKAWDEVIDDYSRVIGMLQLMLDTGTYFLHGPLTGLGERFCEDIITTVPRVFPALKEVPVKLLPSTLGDDAGALGAASLAMESWLPFD